MYNDEDRVTSDQVLADYAAKIEPYQGYVVDPNSAVEKAIEGGDFHGGYREWLATKNPDVNQDHFLESLHNRTPKTNIAFESFWARLEELKDNEALSEQLYGENSDPTSKAKFEEDMADLRKLQESPWGHVAAFLDEKIQQNPAIKKWTEEVVEQILHAFDKSNENK